MESSRTRWHHYLHAKSRITHHASFIEQQSRQDDFPYNWCEAVICPLYTILATGIKLDTTEELHYKMW